MLTAHGTYRILIGLSAILVGLAGPLALFELTQPGHSGNKYYRELHPSTEEWAQLELRSAPVALASPRSERDSAPLMVMPAAHIKAAPPM